MQPKEDFHFHRGCTIAQLSMCPVVFEHNFGSWDPRRHSNLGSTSERQFNVHHIPVGVHSIVRCSHFLGNFQ